MKKDDFTTDFVVRDYEILSEALCNWESSEDGFLDFLGRLRMLGDPPQEFLDEAPEGFADWWESFRKEMFSREQKAKDRRKSRMESATLLKTKVILHKRQLIDQLGDDLFYGDDLINEEESDSESKPKSKPKKKPEHDDSFFGLDDEPAEQEPAEPSDEAEPETPENGGEESST